MDEISMGDRLSNIDYLTQLWSLQLNRPGVHPDDNFFDVGGSSMQAIEMLLSVTNKFGKEIDYAAFFECPSIRTICGLLGR
jgi:acyl carrier protein